MPFEGSSVLIHFKSFPRPNGGYRRALHPSSSPLAMLGYLPLPLFAGVTGHFCSA